MRLPRVLVVSEIPTPYRLPLYEMLASSGLVDLEIVFLAGDEPDRPWELRDQLARLPHNVLAGWAPRLKLSGDTFVYQVNPAILPLLARARPDVIIIGGYAVFAEQIAIGWARTSRTPYVLHSESHLAKSRPGWVSAAKKRILPSVIGKAAAGLAAGTAATRYLESYGLPRDRIRVFPNTVDVEGWSERAADVRNREAEVRARLNLPDRFHLYVGRLTEGKGVYELAEARHLLGSSAPPLVVAGEGPLADVIDRSTGTTLLGFRNETQLAELYALAEATVIPSRAETWGVVVNEALASGCPVIVSDAVGAVEDLVRDGENGRVFPSGDTKALANALSQSMPRLEPGVGPIASWTYGFGVEQFLEAIELATSRSRRRRR